MATHEREQFFGVGVSLGILLGLILGSLVAMRLGDEILDATAQLMDRLTGHEERVNFELLLQ